MTSAAKAGFTGNSKCTAPTPAHAKAARAGGPGAEAVLHPDTNSDSLRSRLRPGLVPTRCCGWLGFHGCDTGENHRLAVRKLCDQ